MTDTPEKPKFCKDCKYLTLNPSTDLLCHAKCAHPSVLDLVSGEISYYCALNRSDTGKCGLTAELFESKLP